MTRLLILISFSIFLSSWAIACDGESPLNSCRDNGSKYLSNSLLRRNLNSYRMIDDQLSTIIKNLSSVTNEKIFLFKILDIEEVKLQVKDCVNFINLQTDEPLKFCREEVLKNIFYYLRANNYIDDTAAVLLLGKTSGSSKVKSLLNKKDILSYSDSMIKVQKKYLENTKLDRDGILPATLNQKEYLRDFYYLKKLTPRQNLFLKYNYIEIRYLGKLYIEFNKMMNAQNAGIFWDYDGDGKEDKIYSLDPADKYKLALKMILLTLEKENQTGGILEGKQPSMLELMSAANELGYISDEVLKELIEIPSLYKKKVPKWKIALKITARIGKGIVMAIPGVNLYAIIPIVLVESYFEGKKYQKRTSDLHLF